MDTLKEIAKIVLGVLAVLGLSYLRLKSIEERPTYRDLLNRSKIRTLFDKERNRMKS
jgi:hypothetical protein